MSEPDVEADREQELAEADERAHRAEVADLIAILDAFDDGQGGVLDDVAKRLEQVIARADAARRQAERDLVREREAHAKAQETIDALDELNDDLFARRDELLSERDELNQILNATCIEDPTIATVELNRIYGTSYAINKRRARDAERWALRAEQERDEAIELAESVARALNELESA